MSARFLTIQNVAHAAVFLVCANDNPPSEDTPKDAVLMNYGIVNARARLRPPYNEQDGYPGYCLGMSPIVVLLSFIAENAQKSAKDQLIAIANNIKDSYRRQREYPALLAVEPEQGDLMRAAMTPGAP